MHPVLLCFQWASTAPNSILARWLLNYSPHPGDCRQTPHAQQQSPCNNRSNSMWWATMNNLQQLEEWKLRMTWYVVVNSWQILTKVQLPMYAANRYNGRQYITTNNSPDVVCPQKTMVNRKQQVAANNELQQSVPSGELSLRPQFKQLKNILLLKTTMLLRLHYCILLLLRRPLEA